MRRSVVVGPAAEADLDEIVRYYERQRGGLGAEFLATVDAVLDRIGRMPDSHAIVYRDVRRALTRRFPFAVYYQLHGDEVLVLAVFHSRRDPRGWKSRA